MPFADLENGEHVDIPVGNILYRVIRMNGDLIITSPWGSGWLEVPASAELVDMLDMYAPRALEESQDDVFDRNARRLSARRCAVQPHVAAPLSLTAAVRPNQQREQSRITGGMRVRQAGTARGAPSGPTRTRETSRGAGWPVGGLDHGLAMDEALGASAGFGNPVRMYQSRGSSAN